MADVEQSIGVKIKAVVEGLPQVQLLSNSIKNLNKGGGVRNTASDFAGLRVRLKDAEVGFAGVSAKASGAGAVLLRTGVAASALLTLLGGLAATKAGQGLFAFVQEGIRFNGEIEKAKIGLASILASTSEIRDENGNIVEGMDAFNAATSLAEIEVKKIQKAAIDTAFEFEDILRAVNSATISLAGTKAEMSEVVSLTTTLSRVASAINLEPEKFNTQIKQILSGSTTVRTDLARAVFGGGNARDINDEIKSLREQGKLIDALNEKTRIYQLTANTVANTFAALSSNLSDAVSQFASDSTLKLFNSIKIILRQIIDGIIDFKSESVKLTPTFQTFADLLNEILGIVGNEMVQLIGDIFGYLADAAQWLAANKDYVYLILGDLLAIANQLVGIVKDVIVFAYSLNQAYSQAVSLHNVLEVIAYTVAIIREAMNIIRSIAAALVGLVGYGLAGAFNVVFQIVDALTGRMGYLLSVTENFLNYFAGVMQTASNGFNNIGNAISEARSRSTGDIQPGDSSFVKRDSILSFSPKRSAGGGAGAGRVGGAGRRSGGGARSREQELSAFRSFLDAMVDLQVEADNKILKLIENANSLVENANRRRYEKGLLDAQEYYAEQKRLQNEILDGEERLARKKLFADQDKIRREIATFFGKSDLSETEFGSFVNRFESGITPKGKDIKAFTAYAKFKKEQIQFEIELSAISKKRAEIEASTAEALEDQSKELKQQILDIQGELAESFGDSGRSQVLGVQKRISDELPKLLQETNKIADGAGGVAFRVPLEQLSQVIKQLNTGSFELADLPRVFTEAGIEVTGLSEDVQNLIRLFERLTFLGTFETIKGESDRILDETSQVVSAITEQANLGLISRQQAQTQILEIQTQSANKLKEVLAGLEAYLLEKGDLVTDAEAIAAAALRRTIEALPTSGLFDSIQTELQEFETNYGLAIEGIRQAQIAGQLSGAEADRISKEAKLELIRLIEEQIAKMEALKSKAPEVASAILDAKNRVAELGNEVNSDFTEIANSINGVIKDSIGGFFDSIIDGSEGIGTAFRKLVSGMLAGIAKVIFQAIVLKAIFSALGLDTSGGGVGGFLGGILGVQKKADGGFISGGGTSVSDSIPALLSNGEAVIPTSSVRAYGHDMIQSIIDGRFMPSLRLAGGAIVGDTAKTGFGANKGSRIVNVLDNSIFKDYLSSAEGEDIILNVIGKNPGIVQRLA